MLASHGDGDGAGRERVMAAPALADTASESEHGVECIRAKGPRRLSDLIGGRMR